MASVGEWPYPPRPFPHYNLDHGALNRPLRRLRFERPNSLQRPIDTMDWISEPDISDFDIWPLAEDVPSGGPDNPERG